jgi:hypothetical protein
MQELLSFSIGQMKLENIILSEISQAQRHEYCMISLIWEILKMEFVEVESKMVGAIWWVHSGDQSVWRKVSLWWPE